MLPIRRSTCVIEPQARQTPVDTCRFLTVDTRDAHHVIASNSRRLQTTTLLWPVDHAFDDKLPVLVLAIFGDLKGLYGILEFERVGEEGFQVDQSSSNHVDRHGAEYDVSRVRLRSC